MASRRLELALGVRTVPATGFFADTWDRGARWYAGLFADSGCALERSDRYLEPDIARDAAPRAAGFLSRASAIAVVDHREDAQRFLERCYGLAPPVQLPPEAVAADIRRRLDVEPGLAAFRRWFGERFHLVEIGELDRGRIPADAAASLAAAATSAVPVDRRPGFVVGCSRSGTTALTNVLNSHRSLAIGMERYKHAFSHHGAHNITAEFFTPERFFRFEPSDTNITPDSNERVAKIYDDIRWKLGAGVAEVLGDKVPPRRPVIRSLSRNLEGSKFVFIFRDVAAVASSFVARADNPQDAWPAQRRHEDALEDWHDAFRTMEDHIDRNDEDSVFVVRYEDLFAGDVELLHSVLRFLGVDPLPEVDLSFEAMTADWGQRRNRPLRLNQSELDWLDRNTDRELLGRFDDLAERHRIR